MSAIKQKDIKKNLRDYSLLLFDKDHSPFDEESILIFAGDVGIEIPTSWIRDFLRPKWLSKYYCLKCANWHRDNGTLYEKHQAYMSRKRGIVPCTKKVRGENIKIKRREITVSSPKKEEDRQK